MAASPGHAGQLPLDGDSELAERSHNAGDDRLLLGFTCLVTDDQPPAFGKLFEVVGQWLRPVEGVGSLEPFPPTENPIEAQLRHMGAGIPVVSPLTVDTLGHPHIVQDDWQEAAGWTERCHSLLPWDTRLIV